MLASFRVRSGDCKFWNGHDEAAAPLADKLQLLHDFVFQVPGKDHYVVWFGFPDTLGVINRDVAARQETPLLVRAAIYRVFDQILADTTVVQQSGALAWGSVARHRFSLARSAQQELQERDFGLFHAFGKGLVGAD